MVTGKMTSHPRGPSLKQIASRVDLKEHRTIGNFYRSLPRLFGNFWGAVKDNNATRQFFVITWLGIMFGATATLVRYPQSLMAGNNDNDRGVTYEFNLTDDLTTGQLFLVSFGFTKGCCNLIVGLLSDRFGRRYPQIFAWMVGIIVPIMVITAQNWSTVVAANIFLGMQQGFGWTTQIFMTVDVAGRHNAGVAIGIASGLGYVVAAFCNLIAAAMIDQQTQNYREDVYYLALALMVSSFLIAIWPLKDTYHFVEAEHERLTTQSSMHMATKEGRTAIVTWPSGKNMKVPIPLMAFVTGTALKKSLVACWIGGIVTNSCVAMTWGLFVSWLKSGHEDGNWRPFTAQETALPLVAFGVVRGFTQIFHGMMGDYIGRRKIIIAGFSCLMGSIIIMSVGGKYIVGFNNMMACFIIMSILMGLGIGTVYPNLMGAVSDHSDPSWRGSALGTYRFWRDIGYGFGALYAGALAQTLGYPGAIGFFSVLIGIALLAFIFLYEEHLASVQDFVLTDSGSDDGRTPKQITDSSEEKGKNNGNDDEVQYDGNGLNNDDDDSDLESGSA